MEYKNRKNFREERRTESEDGSIIVGRNPVLELLKSGRGIEKIYVLKGEREGSITKIYAEARARGINVAETDKQKLDQLAGGNAHQGVAAIAAMKSLLLISLSFIISLDSSSITDSSISGILPPCISISSYISSIEGTVSKT